MVGIGVVLNGLIQERLGLEEKDNHIKHQMNV